MNQTRVLVKFDDLFDALADVQRRKLLLTLLEHDPREDPSVEIGALEDTSSSRVVSLHHVHLPKLAEAGLIEKGEENRVIRKGPDFDKVRPVLTALQNIRDELPRGNLLEDDPSHV